MEAIPAGLADLRPGASERHIQAAERYLGRPLPYSYRSFLLVRDGGRIGDLLILGTPELSTYNKAALPNHLIPFHPVSTSGDFECFDASHEKDGELAVVWYLAERDDSEQTYEDFTDWLLDQLIDLRLS
ncbi:MAG: SMI1/KNR4 family protein [Planctomycetota bacterium]